MPSAESCLERGEICAYIGYSTAFAADAARVARSLTWMSAAERERHDKFRHERDRLMFALGREMARSLVGRALGVAPESWVWREGPHGRPEIAGPASDLHFNLSHSAGVVVCALGRGRAIGVDVEDLNRRAPDQAIVPRYCSPAEAEDVCAQGDHWRDRFLTYWTLKEAYLKARGLGISVHLADISFRLDAAGSARIGFRDSLAGTDDRWAFHLAHLEPHHLAALAIETTDGAAPPVSLRPY
jgi:4'-phosphopantetheinyl transferase